MEKPYTVHETAIVDHGAQIGAGTKIWHWVHICKGATIGKNCILGQNVYVGNRVNIGNRVKIQNNVSIYEDIVLEDNVFCGPSCVFTNVLNPRAHIERKDEFKTTIVKTGATIGANATIVCGNTIGAYALIGAGAVVTKDVKAHAVIAGVPARQIGWVSHTGEILQTKLICPRNGQRYKIVDEQLIEISSDYGESQNQMDC